MRTLRIATRGSQLALVQADQIAERIRRALRVDTELVVIKTSGDRLQGVSLAKMGGKGLFVREIEEALLDSRADLAVHSAKDLPAQIPEELALVAFPRRADPRDALVGRRGAPRLDSLPRAARVGTGSVRRRSQLLAHRPDLEVVPLWGNVPTRIRKLEEQSLDAVVLACAGLERLGMAAEIDERIPPEVLLPAPCQGALVVEARRGEALAADLEVLSDPASVVQALAERSFVERLGGDCSVPAAALAEPLPDARIRLRGLLANLEGTQIARAELEATDQEAVEAGRRLAESVLAEGGQQILHTLGAESAP